VRERAHARDPVQLVNERGRGAAEAEGGGDGAVLVEVVAGVVVA